jgi:RHS repeat-associated protein
LGNVRCKFDSVNTQFFDYTPFGEEIDGMYNDDNGWISSERDAESSYMNLQARLYDPAIGSFLSVDPLFESQPGFTPYHYCYNDPI